MTEEHQNVNCILNAVSITLDEALLDLCVCLPVPFIGANVYTSCCMYCLDVQNLQSGAV